MQRSRSRYCGRDYFALIFGDAAKRVSKYNLHLIGANAAQLVSLCREVSSRPLRFCEFNFQTAPNFVRLLCPFCAAGLDFLERVDVSVSERSFCA